MMGFAMPPLMELTIGSLAWEEDNGCQMNSCLLREGHCNQKKNYGEWRSSEDCAIFPNAQGAPRVLPEQLLASATRTQRQKTKGLRALLGWAQLKAPCSLIRLEASR